MQVCPAPPLLDPRGARVVLGAQVGAPIEPLSPRADTLFGPRGACLAAPGGPLFACDTGHHRVLVWREAPAKDAQPADFVLGHADFGQEGRGTLNMPSSVAVEGDILAVADSWNHRVLLWRGLPQRARPADVVIEGFFWCYGVALHRGRLIVADTGNKRVLVWDRVPRANGAPPERALPGEMRWPHGIACIEDFIFIADAGVGGVLAWKDFQVFPLATDDTQAPYGVAVRRDEIVVSDTAASRLLGFDKAGGAPRSLAGQRGFKDRGDNRWRAAARDSLCWPYGVSACGDTLVISDTGNNRVLLWDKA